MRFMMLRSSDVRLKTSMNAKGCTKKNNDNIDGDRRRRSLAG